MNENTIYQAIAFTSLAILIVFEILNPYIKTKLFNNNESSKFKITIYSIRFITAIIFLLNLILLMLPKLA